VSKKEMKALQADRVRLYRDAARFRKPERIPHFANAVTWKVFDAGHTLDEVMTDQKRMEECVRHFLDTYFVDGLIDTGIRNQFNVTEAFGDGWYYYYTPEAIAIHDHAHCTVDTLMEYLDDPVKYAWEVILPKKFGDGWAEKPLSVWKKTFKEYLKYTMFIIHMAGVSAGYGIPVTAPNNPSKGSIDIGMEILESNLLGIRQLSIALRRNADLIEEFCRRWDAEHIDPIIRKNKAGDGPNYKYCFDASILMLAHNIMSPKQFERFYQPTLGRLLRSYEEKDMNVRIFTEGRILGMKDFFRDYKPGTLTFHLEQDDVFEVRKELPNVCVMGGLTTDLLYGGTPEECVSYTKKLCEELGSEGGFILSEGKMLSFRNDAKSENYKAICDYMKEQRN
jgi:hypothetical protein